MFEFSAVLIAFLLTLFAGLATGIGSALAFFTKKTNKIFLCSALGFSAGVMIYVSFMEILPQGITSLTNDLGKTGSLIGIISFFVGILLIGIIDKLVPSEGNPHEIKDVEDIDTPSSSKHLLRLGLFSALAITIHNFPEGIATFMAALSNPGLGLSIAIAIAIHNIPEGIAVSVPIYYATGDKKKAFKYSFLSGLAEPLGGLIAFLFLMPFLNDTILGIVFAMVAGIMVFISIDELLPAAHKYGEHHITIYGFIFGMAIMAISLVVLQ